MKKLLLILLLIPTLLAAQTKEEQKAAIKIAEKNWEFMNWSKVAPGRYHLSFKNRCVSYPVLVNTLVGERDAGGKINTKVAWFLAFDHANILDLQKDPQEGRIYSKIKVKIDNNKTFNWYLMSDNAGDGTFLMIPQKNKDLIYQVNDFLKNQKTLEITYKDNEKKEYSKIYKIEGIDLMYDIGRVTLALEMNSK